MPVVSRHGPTQRKHLRLVRVDLHPIHPRPRGDHIEQLRTQVQGIRLAHPLEPVHELLAAPVQALANFRTQEPRRAVAYEEYERRVDFAVVDFAVLEEAEEVD